MAAAAAVLRVSILAAATIVAVVLAMGSAALRSDLLAVALACAFGGMLFARRLIEAGLRHVEDEPLQLRCPLLALRAPRDEASLVIGLAQVAQGLAQAAARWVGLAARPMGRLFTAVSLPDELEATAPRWRRALHGAAGFALMVMCLWPLALVGAWFDVWKPPAYRESGGWWWAWWGIGGFYVGAIVLLLMLLAALLAWSLPAMGISLAAGREAFMLPGVTQVEAEPLPYARGADGTGAAAMALEILYDARPAGLNHSLYDAPEVRERIAQWLREQAGLALGS